MATARTRFAAVIALVRELLAVHARILIPLAVAVAVGFVALGLLLVLYAMGIGALAYQQLVAFATTAENASLVTVGLMIPIIVMAIFASLTWAGLAVQLANAAGSRRRISTGNAALVALRRAPRVFVLFVIVVAATVAAILLAPLLTLAGLVGLLLSMRFSRLPRRGVLIAMAVPFGVALLILVRWSLAPASVWLANTGIRAALAESAARVRGRELPVGVTLAIVAGLTVLVTEIILGLARLRDSGVYGEFVGQLVALVLIGPLLFAALAVHYRRGGEDPPKAQAVRARAARLTRTAVAVIVAMLVPMLLVGNPATAEAAGSGEVAYSISVEPASPFVAGAPVSLRFSVADLVGGGEPTGTISVNIDGGPDLGPFTLVAGSYTLPQTFSVGSHLIESHYWGDLDYAEADASRTVSAAYASTVDLTASAPTPVYGTANTLTATITTTGTPTGTVEFTAFPTVGSPITFGPTAVSSGIATVDASALLPGSYTVSAAYSGDATHLMASVHSVPLDVIAANAEIAFDIDPENSAIAFSPAGTVFTATVTVTSPNSPEVPSGSVLVRPQGGGTAYDTQALVAGVAEVSFTLPPGLPAVVFEYVPDPGFNSANIDHTLYVSKFVSTVSLTADPTPSALGESVELTATVDTGTGPVATGDVTFEATPSGGGSSINLGPATLDGSGVAVLSTSALPIGDYTIVASYAGDAQVASDSGSATHSVGKGAVTVSVGSSIPAPAFGNTPNLNINVTPVLSSVETPGGSVEVWRDGTLLDTVTLNGAGAVTVPVGVGAAGDRHFTVKYLGDANFAAADGLLDLTVSKVATTTTLLPLGDANATYGDSLTFDGNVSSPSGPAPTGSVQLYVGGYHVADGTLSAGAFSIVTDLSPAAPGLQDVWIVYPGDANHVNSESFPRRSLQVDSVSSVPVLSVSPTVFGIGSTVTVTAAFDAYGAGPAGGDITFTDSNGTSHVGTYSGNTASTTFVIGPTMNTVFNAHYDGNDNYEPADAAPLLVSATQVSVTVTMTAPGPRVYGEVFNLSATVALDGGAPATGNVTFDVVSVGELTPTVPVVGGVATLQVCAGDEDGCPVGVPLLGTDNSTITATYAETSISLEGVSSPVPFTITDATTTTTLVMNPTTVRPNSGLINLTATVTNSSSAAIPDGHVVFEYTKSGGTGLIANVTLDSLGVAHFSTTLGGAFISPADGVKATFVASTPPGVTDYVEYPFTASSDSESLVIDLYSLSLSTSVSAVGGGSPVVGSPAVVTVTFNPEAGSTATFPNPVTVTADTGATCTVTAAPGTSTASCNLAWTTAGSHTITATYPGDTAFEPATSAPGGVSLTKGTPNLAPNLITNPVMALTDATVTWSLFHAGATGTVTVIADGVTWCTAVPVADQSCTGQFPLSSANASTVTVRVQYSGDTNWESREQTTGAIVKRCVPVNVTSSDSSLGTVTIVTPSNCPGGEYLSGTMITVSAHPIAPNVFVDWKKLGGLSLVHDSYLPTMSFVASADFMTWVRVATFSANCYPVTAAITGHGGMSVYPVANCAIPGGGGGYLPGTVVAIYPDTAYNPNYDEHDAFYSFGTVTGATLKKDSSARPYLSVAVNSPLSIPVKFGPQCRPVSVVFDPATKGDAATVSTPENCQSPLGNGFLRYTEVDVHALSGDPSLAIVGWKLDGIAKPDWGTSNDQAFLVESAKPVLTVNLVHCYTLDVTLDGAQDARSREVGAVDIDTKPNCPDGSARYLTGTKVTLTPEVLVEDGTFTGWDLVRIPGVKPAEGKGKLPAQAKILTMTADVTVKAGFVFPETCSSIQIIDNIFDNAKIFTLDDDGCGESQYFDLQKQTALRDGAPQESFWQDNRRSDLFAHINPDVDLDVYLSVRGDTGTCFDGVTPTGPTENPDAWKTYGPLTGDVDCAVGGPIQIEAAACQTVKSTVSFIAENDASGKVYPREWFPGTFYLPNADGTVGAFDQASFEWMVTSNVYVDNGVVKLADLGDDPCTRGGANTYTVGRNLAVYGLGLSSGFEVAGWDDLDPDARVEGNPVLIETDDSGPVFPVNPVFSVTCGTLVLGEGMSVIDGARCPGSSAQENSFVMGTAIQVRAAQSVGDRVLYGFKSGVVSGQIVEEPVTKRLIGFVVMDLDGKAVTGDYPTKTEAIGRAIVQGLKISAGILAILAPITLGLLFPPAGIFFAFLGAAAGIVNLIPHGKEVAGVLDLINPTKITTCAARWGFSNTGNPTGGLNAGSIGSLAWTGFKVYKGKDVITQNIGKFGIGGAVLGTATGLYEAGIHHAELGPQSVEQLAGTSTMTGCLDDQWRIANSNLTGN